MCGIAGVWLPGRPRAALATLVEGMARTIVHRGPDHGASFIDAEAGLALAYRRLAVIDTSPEGNQPMVSRCGRYVLVFNGELYNAADLRAAHLAGQPLRGHSDTEVLVEVIARRGVEATLPALNGMYAFALWDRPRRRLTLARDHVGIKPLYWLQTPEGVVFGSELRCLMAAPVWERRIDRAALGAFLRHNYVPAPHTIFAGVRKLEPGRAVTIGPGGAAEPFRHWDFDRVAREGLADPLPAGEDAAADALDALLRDAVGRQMVADVPLGAFLSGGIDSSTVVAVMQALSPRPVRTFSIGF
ncbi:MAG: asparagine synthetase B, partial [Rhodospirillaceae bacterium]|nr:asparagine synthetase B [Rhodospirillaceae bacterium]